MGTNVVAVSSASPVAAPPTTPSLVFPSVATQLTGQVTHQCLMMDTICDPSLSPLSSFLYLQQEPVTGSGVNTEQSIERPLGITIEVINKASHPKQTVWTFGDEIKEYNAIYRRRYIKRRLLINRTKARSDGLVGTSRNG